MPDSHGNGLSHSNRLGLCCPFRLRAWTEFMMNRLIRWCSVMHIVLLHSSNYQPCLWRRRMDPAGWLTGFRGWWLADTTAETYFLFTCCGASFWTWFGHYEAPFMSLKKLFDCGLSFPSGECSWQGTLRVLFTPQISVAVVITWFSSRLGSRLWETHHFFFVVWGPWNVHSLPHILACKIPLGNISS